MVKKKPKQLKVSPRQSGKVKSIPADRARSAMKPGQRRSKRGKKYWETRRNRSDKNKKTRL